MHNIQLDTPCYIIWNPKGDNPSHKHQSLESAREEAKRLSNLCPDNKFYVLRAIESHMTIKTPHLVEHFPRRDSKKYQQNCFD